MSVLFETTWLTLIGVSFLFVGAFVLWVYGAQNTSVLAPANDGGFIVQKTLRTTLVKWFFLYGVVAVLFGGACLLTAAVMLL